eukprot:GEMP01051504.1.p1 GENE.GEMP01051504.1~~GEMP01051504.1.p1  ORF type:complete len:270 (+),score=57.22 GEMP01051504.1:547-1356(+)
MMLKQEQEHVGFLAPNTVAHSGVQNVSMSPSFRGSKLSLDLASGSNMLFFAFLVILAAILLAVFFVYEVPRIVRLFRVDEANADARKEKEDVSPGSESAESSDEDYDYFAPNRHQLRPKDGKKVEKSSSGNTVATFPDDPASSGWFGSSTNPTGSLEKKDKDSTRASNELSSRLSKENLVAKAGSPSSKGSSEQVLCCWSDSMAKTALQLQKSDSSFVGSLATGYLAAKTAHSPSPSHSPRWVPRSPGSKNKKRRSSKKTEETQKNTSF